MAESAEIASIEPTPTGHSRIERLDPRTRLFAAVAFVIAVIALDDLRILMVALLAALGLAWMARLPFAHLRRRMVHVEGFMLLLLVLLPLTTPGAPVWTLGPLSASEQGLRLSLSILLTVNASVLALFALLSSLETVRLGHAMAGLGVPDKLAQLFLFTVRYIGVFRAEAARLHEAMRARAFVAGSNRHTWRSLGNLVGLLLIRSLERAERVDEAMRCRGFSGRLPMLTSTSRSRGDLVFGCLIGLVIAALLGADWAL